MKGNFNRGSRHVNLFIYSYFINVVFNKPNGHLGASNHHQNGSNNGDSSRGSRRDTLRMSFFLLSSNYWFYYLYCSFIDSYCVIDLCQCSRLAWFIKPTRPRQRTSSWDGQIMSWNTLTYFSLKRCKACNKMVHNIHFTYKFIQTLQWVPIFAADYMIDTKKVR